MRWTRRLALAGISLLATLLLGEAVARLAARSSGRPHDGRAALLAMWKLANGMSADLGQGEVVVRGDQGEARVMLHPYLGFDASSGLEQYSADIELFRRPDSGEVFDVAILGGSVAFIADMNSRQVLIDTLRQDPRLADREVRVHCYARGAFKQPQQAQMLIYLLNLGIRPDAVINIDGYNEFAHDTAGVHPIQPYVNFFTSVVAGAATTDSAAVALREKAIGRTVSGRNLVVLFAGLKLQHSALACWVATQLLRRNRALLVADQDAYTEHLMNVGRESDGSFTRAALGPRLPEGVSSLDECARIWLESSRILQAICAGHGIHYAHVLQPTLHDAGSKSLTKDEVRTGTLYPRMVEAVRQGYPRLRELGLTLAAEGVAFRDASRLFAEIEQTLYYDACHFESPRTDMLLRASAETLLGAMPWGDLA